MNTTEFSTDYTNPLDERRTFTRLDFDHPVRWNHASGDHGVTTVRNVSRGGLCLSLGQFFRPGPVVEFEFEDILFEDVPVRFEAIVAWCHPTQKNSERFDTGFRIVYDTPQLLTAISEVVYRALEQGATLLPADASAPPCGCEAV